MPTANEKARARRIYDRLQARYPDAKCALIHDGPFQLLVATVLSAQCTDKLINQVTPELFATLPTADAMARAPLELIESKVRRVNFWRNKAKHLKGLGQMLMDEHGGVVPDDMDALIQLPGVARKTANVVLGNAFNKAEGVVVDTHIGRLSRRFGFTTQTDPKKVEPDLMALFARSRWTMLAHLLIYHGRAACKANHAKCAEDDICRAYCANARAQREGLPPVK